MRIDGDYRRMNIYLVLQRAGKIQMKSLAQQFHVSVSTIRLDIALLQTTHPITTKRGRNGCVVLQNEEETFYCGCLTSSHIALLERILLQLQGRDEFLMTEILQAIQRQTSKSRNMYHQ